MASAKVSKNAREGVRSKSKARTCSKGEPLVRVKVVPVFGRARLEWRCACNSHS